MSLDDADLAAVRETISARTTDPAPALARSWATIAARQAAEPSVPAPGRRVRWLVPAGAAVTVAALAVGTTALLAGDAGGPDRFDPLSVPRITDPEQITFPIDEYDYTNEGYANYVTASQVLIRECLVRFGLDLPEPEPPTPTGLPEFDRQWERLYGVFDRELAAEWGYRVPPEPPEERVDPGWSDDEMFLLEGRTRPEFAERPLPHDVNGDPLPVDGCIGEAQRLLAAGLPDPDFRITNNDSWIQADQDERVAAADAAWSECMRRNGYEYESYADSMGDPYDTPHPTSEEIAEAVANVDCKVETNLVGVLVAVTSEFQEQFIEDNWDDLQELKHWLETVYENSARVLAEHGD